MKRYDCDLIAEYAEGGWVCYEDVVALEVALEDLRRRLARHEPVEGCEEAWREYVSLREKIRRSTDMEEKGTLMARAMEVARPYDFTALELRTLEAQRDELIVVRELQRAHIAELERAVAERDAIIERAQAARACEDG